MTNKLKSSVIFFLLISKSIFSQWQYEVEGKSLEKIFVDDTKIHIQFDAHLIIQFIKCIVLRCVIGTEH